MAALNIQIEVPNLGMYEIEALKHKVTAYAKKLIAASNVAETKIVNKQYNHESLAGIFSDDWSADELRNEYLQDKYGI